MEDGSTPFKKYFIGGLSWTTDEESVKAFFEVQGFVVEKTQIMRNKSSGRSRGFGFIMLHSEGPEPLSQYDLDGRQIEVKSAVPKEEMGIRTKKIFVGGLPVQLNQTVFQQHFARYGPIVEAQIMKDRKNSRSRGFGFVRFQSEDTVELVLKDEHFIMGKQVEVKKALPKHALQPKGDQEDDSNSDEESSPIPTKSSSPTPPTTAIPAPSPPAPTGPAPLPAPNPPPERSEGSPSREDKPPVGFHMYPPYHTISSYHHPFVQTAVPHFFGYPPTDFPGNPQVMSHPAYPPVGPFYMDSSFYPSYVPQSTVPRTDSQPKSKSPTHEGHHQEGLKGPNNKSNNHSRPNKHSSESAQSPKSHIPVHTSVSVPSSSKPSRVASKTHSSFVSITGGKRESHQSRPSGIQSRVHGPEATVSAPASPQVMRPAAILSQEPQDHQEQVYLLRNPKSQQADRAPGGPPLFVGYPADDEEDDPEKEPPQLDSGSLFSSSVETLFPLSKSRSYPSLGSEKGVLSFDLYGKRRNSRNVRGSQAGNFSQTF